MYQTMHLPTVRFSVAGPFAVVITFSLFFLMQYLIENTGENTLDESESVFFVDFVRLFNDPEEIKDPFDNTTIKPVEPPPDLTVDDWKMTDPTDTIIGIPPVTKNFIPTDESLLTPSFNTEPISVVEAQPIYPQKAISKNIEGYVIVEFTVTESGTTDSIRIVEAEPDNIFNRSAVKATSKSRYRPRIVGGKAIAVSGMRKMFTFELED